MEPQLLVGLGFLLFLVGFALIFIAMLLMFLRPSGRARVRGGGVVLIGPVPIVFGDLKYARPLIILAVVLLAVLVVISLVLSGWPAT